MSAPIQWSPDSKFLLFTTVNSGGHYPWHFGMFVFCATDNSFRAGEEAIGTVISDQFRFEPPDVTIMTIQQSGNDGEPLEEKEIKVPLAKTMPQMQRIK